MTSDYLHIHFRGICTQLNPHHPEDTRPKLQLQTSRPGVPVTHRVFLPNSKVVDKYIPDHGICRHQVRMRFHDADGELVKLELDRQMVWFEGANENTPPAPPLGKLPNVIDLTGPIEPQPDHDAINGRNDKAAAYVDFFGGETLVALPDHEVFAHLRLAGKPRLVVAPFPGERGRKKRWKLKPGTFVEISNQPRKPSNCGEEDYLLHYFVTDLDLHEHRPKWAGIGGPDTIFCSSSGYP
jgi:hypothetical protein